MPPEGTQDRNVGQLHLPLPSHLTSQHVRQDPDGSPPPSPAEKNVSRSSSFTRNTRFLTGANLTHREALGLLDVDSLAPPALRFAAAQNLIRDWLFADGGVRPPPPPPSNPIINLSPPSAPSASPASTPSSTPPRAPPLRLRAATTAPAHTLQQLAERTAHLRAAKPTVPLVHAPFLHALSDTSGEHDGFYDPYDTDRSESGLSDMADEIVHEQHPVAPTAARSPVVAALRDRLHAATAAAEAAEADIPPVRTQPFRKFRSVSSATAPAMFTPVRPVARKPAVGVRDTLLQSRTREDITTLAACEDDVSYTSANEEFTPLSIGLLADAAAASKAAAAGRQAVARHAQGKTPSEPTVESITTSSSGFSNAECVPSYPAGRDVEILGANGRPRVFTDTSSSSRPNSATKVLPNFGGCNSHSVTAQSFLIGPTVPPQVEDYCAERNHMRKDSHHAFLQSLDEPMVKEPRDSNTSDRVVEDIGVDVPTGEVGIRKTKSGLQKRIAQAKDASAGIVARAKKLPRAASMSRFRPAVERGSVPMVESRTNKEDDKKDNNVESTAPTPNIAPAIGTDKKPSKEEEYKDKGSKDAVAGESKDKRRKDAAPAAPVQLITKDKTPNGIVPTKEEEPEPEQAPKSETLPEFVTIKRLIRRVKQDGSEEIISRTIRMRPEEVLPNGDVVVKRVMQRMKDDGSGMETLTVRQVIPRQKNSKATPTKPIEKTANNDEDSLPQVKLDKQVRSLGATASVPPTASCSVDEQQSSAGERTASLPSALLDRKGKLKEDRDEITLGDMSSGRLMHRSQSFGTGARIEHAGTASVRMPGCKATVELAHVPPESVGINQRFVRRMQRVQNQPIRRAKSAKMRRTPGGFAREEEVEFEVRQEQERERDDEDEGKRVTPKGTPKGTPKKSGFWTRNGAATKSGAENTNGNVNARRGLPRVLSFPSRGSLDNDGICMDTEGDGHNEAKEEVTKSGDAGSTPVRRRLRGVLRGLRGGERTVM